MNHFCRLLLNFKNTELKYIVKSLQLHNENGLAYTILTQWKVCPTVCMFTNLDFTINCVAYGIGVGTSLPVPSRFCDTEHYSHILNKKYLF